MSDLVRQFAAELAKLLVLQGFDIDVRVLDREVSAEAHLHIDKRSGARMIISHKEIEYSRLAPMSLAIEYVDRIRVSVPPPA